VAIASKSLIMTRVQKIAIVIVVLVIVLILAVIGQQWQRSYSCRLLRSVTQSKSTIDLLDHSTGHFASSTKDLIGQSTEGGVQIIYSDNGERKIVEQRFYKETGRAYMRLYFDNGNPFALVTLDENYAVPISVDNNPTIASGEEHDYYLGPNGQVCRLDINGVSQPIDKDTRDMVQKYIAGIRL
jgi:hypothetical protein